MDLALSVLAPGTYYFVESFYITAKRLRPIVFRFLEQCKLL